MKIALGLPTGAAVAAPAALRTWVARAEAGPFSSVAVLDRVVSRGYEPLAVLASVAMATQRLGLITSVVVAPIREPTLLARQALTIDALSGGRLSLGVAIGVREDDYRASGGEFRARGRRMDDMLPVLRRLLSGGPLGDGIGPLGPTPVRPAGPEILVGGYVPAVARRIASWGDGFMAPGGGRPDEMQALWRRIVDAWNAAGRDASPRWVGASYYALGPEATRHAAAYIDAMYGHDPDVAARRLASIPTTPAGVRALIETQEGIGVDELILRPCAAALDQLERLADLVA